METIYAGDMTDVEWNVLRRMIVEDLGEAILSTCWVQNCNRPIAARMRAASGRISLVCKKHAKRIKPTQQLLHWQPKASAAQQLNAVNGGM